MYLTYTWLRTQFNVMHVIATCRLFGTRASVTTDSRSQSIDSLNNGPTKIKTLYIFLEPWMHARASQKLWLRQCNEVLIICGDHSRKANQWCL